MCGISGIVKSNILSDNLYRNRLQNMTDAMIHRGPDSEGHEYFNNCFLGFRRLAIIDTSSQGNQPMYSLDKKKCIVFNGEIYNYKSLKKDLGYSFSNSTDTEVLLALFDDDYDEGKLRELNGMFAFALWNEENNQLFCARDRFGQKPFFYAIGNNGEFIFASEIKSIMATGLVSKEINKEGLLHYLKYSHLHPEQSIFTHVKVLPPASYLIYKENKIEIKRYWSIDDVAKNLDSENDAIKKIEQLTQDAIYHQLNADVPIGAFLSGGYDSGTVVAIASEYHKNITTVAFGYDNQLNELPLAKEISVKYNTKHTEVKANLNDLGALIQKIYSQLDEPTCDTSIPASYLVNKEAKNHMTVVLSGNAGDELFGGYSWYNKEFSILQSKGCKQGLAYLKALNFMAKKLKLENINKKITNKIIASKYNSIIKYHKDNVQIFFRNEDLKSLMDSDCNFEYQYPFTLQDNDLNTCLKMDLYKTLAGGYLVKDDRISMLNSIEIRIPFLDNNLVDYVLNLDYHYKVDEINTKIIFKKTFGNRLTENILNKKKQGFGAPVNQWLRQQSMEHLTNTLLKDKTARIFDSINYEATQQFLNYDFKHWNLLILAIWMESSLQ